MNNATFERLIRELSDRDPQTRRQALAQLGELGDERAVIAA